MRPRFSLVYPTRHRPQFVARALSMLQQQAGDDFEVIVSDNFTDAAQSCEEVCLTSGISTLKYVKPPAPVGMVGNWNHAASFATGEYVALFTDKMFLLPDALARIRRLLDGCVGANEAPEIISWVSDSYQPAMYPDYFGEGVYTAAQSDRVTLQNVHCYVPLDALNAKAGGSRSRYEQSPSQYCRGKIVFGAYHRNLIKRIVDVSGALFHDISPDYTSMILGLSLARSAVELKSSAVVSINTDVSNGTLGSVHDQHALNYLKSLADNPELLFRDMLVPGLYAAQHNIVSHDYLSLRKRFALNFEFSTVNWLVHCIEDLSKSDRQWSSSEVEAAQMQLLYGCVATLPPETQTAVVKSLEARVAARSGGHSHALPGGQSLNWKSPSLADAMARRGSWG